MPSRNERRQTAASVTCSIQSAPIPCSLENVATNTYAKAVSRIAYMSGVPGIEVEQQYFGRRWTFFEIGKTPRGAPRGLTVPYMYIKQTVSFKNF